MIKDDSLVLKLAPEELLIIGKLIELAKEAKDDATTINEKYIFTEGQDKIKIWDDNFNGEYITNDYMWHADYASEQFIVRCTTDDIYELYRDQFLYYQECTDSELYKRRAKIATHFKAFVRHTRMLK